MANMTLAIPDDLHLIMKEHADIKWSEVARQAFIARLSNAEKLRLANAIAQKSKLTPEDVREISAKIKKGMAKRFRRDYDRYERLRSSTHP